MLHRSFKPAKCKTSLKLATSRIKLLKNKKEVLVRQLKRELAQLLESGQEQTARIRVEHVIREEKMMAAYDLLQIYCELIVARLPIIESQKNCPIDLKEAITSVTFASPRCADITELVDVSKHFKAKYGKEFISAAVELRPECGVNRSLVEKLSAVAPDGQTKIKILSAVAEEHNIKWDPKSFAEKDSKPPDDLLNGPNTFKKASNMYTETLNPQAPNVQAPSSHDQKHDQPVNPFNQKFISSPNVQSFPSTSIAGTKPTIPDTFAPEVRPPGTEAERREVGQSFSADINAFPPGGQNWNMEFKDATSAALAAAESAERASMAARAAAQFATRGTSQNSEQSQKSNARFVRDEEPERYASSKLPSEHIAKNRKFKSPNEQIDGNEHNNTVGSVEKSYRGSHGSIRRSSRPASSRSSNASISDDFLVNKGYPRSSLSKENAVQENEGVFFDEIMKKQSRESDVEIVSDRRRDGFRSRNKDPYVDKTVTKDSSAVSARGHTSTLSGDYNVAKSSRQEFGNDTGEEPFVGVNQGNVDRDSVETSSHDDNAIVFDEHDTDDDDCKFDKEPEYDEDEAKLFFPSPGRESPARLLPRADSWNPGEGPIGSFEKSSSQSNISTAELHTTPEFSENVTKSANPSESDNIFITTYDHSDGDGPNSGSEDDSESGKELKLGTLPGGFRNKGYTQPPYRKEVAEDTSSTIEQPTDSFPVKSSSSSEVSTKMKNKSSPQDLTHDDTDSDFESNSDTEEVPQQTLQSNRQPENQKATKEENRKSSLKVKVTYFDDEDDDSKEDVLKQTSSSGDRLGSGVSRRTKASPSRSETNAYSRVTTDSKESRYTNSSAERPEYQNSGSDQRGGSDRSKPTKLAASKPLPESKITFREENAKSSAVERPLSPPQEPAPETPWKENSAKKTSHVHPKLPDFDTIAALLQSGRSDR